MAKNTKKKTSKFERKRRINLIIVAILIVGFIMTTLLSIFLNGVA